MCFKNAKQYDQAKDAYLKEAEYHTENKTYPLRDLSTLDTAVFWLWFIISLTCASDFFMLQSKYIVRYVPSNKSAPNKKNPLVLLKLSSLFLRAIEQAGMMMKVSAPTV